VTPQKALAEAVSALNLREAAIAAFERVLILDPGSAAQTHFKLAQLWKETDPKAKAKRHLLDSQTALTSHRSAFSPLAGAGSTKP
jgi:hypothetical protein